MSIINSALFKSHVNRYSILGLAISLASIVLATMVVAYQMTGTISLESLIAAQTSNFAIWALDLTPFMFAYWGQSFCYGLANKAETLLQDKTQELLSKKDSLESKLKYESTHDNLTKLPNYKLFIERVKQAITQIDPEGKVAVIVLNINDFKEINYGFGSIHANTFLKQFAEKLKAMLLEPALLEAYMGINVIARLRNDEFAILLPRLSAKQDIEEILENISRYTTTNFMIESINMKITTTVGAAVYPTHGFTAETLMVHATDSIYFAKKEGKPYIVYHAGIQERTKINREMLDEFEHVIDNDKAIIQFIPHYELATKKIIGVEAVVKIEHIDWEVLNEEKLFQLMDDSRYAKKLTFFTLKNTIKQVAFWHEQGHKIYGEVDLSISDLGDNELIEIIKALLEEHHLEAKFLKIAFTEKACLSDQSKALAALNNLANLGMELLIKDFSTGYTSFIYLTNYPISEIKIDRSFVMKMLRDEKRVRIVQTIIQLATALNLKVMAAGIPDQSSVDKLLESGCHFGQGPYFSTALSVEEMNDVLQGDGPSPLPPKPDAQPHLH